jgi:hypothetical protein
MSVLGQLAAAVDMDISGLSVEKTAELLGELTMLPASTQAAWLKKIGGRQGTNDVSGSRGELMKRIALLPADIQNGLLTKRLQLADTRFYQVKSVAGLKTIKMFENTDNKKAGLGNIANAKLEKDNYFILTGIILLTGVDPEKAHVAFDLIPDVIRNGEFQFEVNTKKMVGQIDNEVFNTAGRNDVLKGFYKLDNPKMVEPQVDIALNVDFADVAAANTWMKAVLVGSSVIPY